MIRIAVCDAGASFVAELAEILGKWAYDACLNAEFHVYESLNDLLTEMELHGHMDLVFLDLRSVNGISEAAGRIRREDAETELVFVSDKAHIRRELVCLRPLDCVGKPLCEDEIRGLLCRFLELRDRERFIFRCRQRIIALAVRKIRYLYHFNRKLYIFCGDDRHFETYMRMEEAESILNRSEAVFFRAHASYLVNLLFVEQLSRSLLYLDGGGEIPVGRPYGAPLLRYYEEYFRFRNAYGMRRNGTGE